MGHPQNMAAPAELSCSDRININVYFSSLPEEGALLALLTEVGEVTGFWPFGFRPCQS